MTFLFNIIYFFLTILIAPFVFLYLKHKKTFPSFGKEIDEFRGIIKKDIPNEPIWFHTVSVGESKGAIPLIKKILNNYSENIVVTTSTTTSKELYKKEISNITHCFAPIDSPIYVKRFFKKVKPKALVIMETELWPNILSYAYKHNIPVFLINARMSERSKNRYLKLGKIFQNIIAKRLTHIICQTEKDSKAFKELGFSDNCINISGSIKYDLEPREELKKQGERLREPLKDKHILCLASSHAPEEKILLDSFKILKESIPNLVMLIIPRHPERFQEVYQLAVATNYSVAKRSENNITTNTDIIIGDTMGELELYFGMSDLIIMGGSLTNIGGHNPLEAISLNKPIITGDIFFNFKEIYQELIQYDGCLVVTKENLNTIIPTLILNPEKLHNLANNAYDVYMKHKGAIDQSLKILNKSLSFKMHKEKSK
jgi:3-deoxy-D-manno-octulosonic-acid transferase